MAAAIGKDAKLASKLGIAPDVKPAMVGWIVDTSLHHDGERFGGFRKVSLEEVMIALRDDSQKMKCVDRESLLAVARQSRRLERGRPSFGPSLYPAGFSFPEFVDAVESGRMWRCTAGEQ